MGGAAAAAGIFLASWIIARTLFGAIGKWCGKRAANVLQAITKEAEKS